MLVVVLNDWVTETKETPWASNVSTNLAKSARGQPIDLIDDDHVDPSRLHVNEQLLERWPLHRPTGEAAVVVTIPNQSPALVCLALDVGLACFPLGVEGIEVLFDPLVGRDARIDRVSTSPARRVRTMSWWRCEGRRSPAAPGFDEKFDRPRLGRAIGNRPAHRGPARGESAGPKTPVST